MMQNQIAAQLQAAVAAMQAGQFDQGIQYCQAVLQAMPGQPDAQHLLALNLSKKGDIAAADQAFRDAARNNPRIHEVLNNHANMLRRAGRTGEAITLLRAATKKNPTFAEAWFSLGLALADQGALAEADQAYRHCLKLNPAHIQTMTSLGGLLNRQERYEEARVILDQALDLQPQNPIALNNRGTARTELHDLTGALKDYQSAANLQPTNAELVANYARALQRAGDNASAVEIYRQAVAIDPGNRDAHDDLNRLLWETGREDEFLGSVDAALKSVAAEKKIDLLLLKARLARLTGNLATAREATEEVLFQTPEHPRALAGLALLQSLADEYVEAGQSYENALRLAPDDFDIRHAFAEFLLTASGFDQAMEVLAPEPSQHHLQKHIALKALAMRGTGSDEYRRWYDYKRFTAKLEIDLPSAYASIESFLAAIEEELTPLFDKDRAPADQTLFNGAQSPGHLWHYTTPALVALRDSLLKTAARFIAALPDDPGHPFLAQKPTGPEVEKKLAYSAAWAVRLRDGGGHVDHIHPAGWISASHYVKVPESIQNAPEEGEKGGWLRLGASGVSGLSMPPEKYIRPEPGTAIFFPSYLWHGVEPFHSPEERITSPFDLKIV